MNTTSTKHWEHVEYEMSHEMLAGCRMHTCDEKHLRPYDDPLNLRFGFRCDCGSRYATSFRHDKYCSVRLTRDLDHVEQIALQTLDGREALAAEMSTRHDQVTTAGLTEVYRKDFWSFTSTSEFLNSCENHWCRTDDKGIVGGVSDEGYVYYVCTCCGTVFTLASLSYEGVPSILQEALGSAEGRVALAQSFCLRDRHTPSEA